MCEIVRTARGSTSLPLMEPFADLGADGSFPRMVDPNRTLTTDETEAVLGLLRAGRTALLAWGPCGRSYSWQHGHFVCAEWEEGNGSTQAIDEAAVRTAIVAHPGAFRRVLQEPVREEFRRAFLADERERARPLLADEAFANDPKAELLAVFLAWPATPPAEVQARLAKQLGKHGPDAFRMAVGMAAFDRDPATTNRRGVAFLDTLDSATGGGGGHRFARAEWLLGAGDLPAALADFRCVLADPQWPEGGEVRRAAARASELLQRLRLTKDDPRWFDVDAVLRSARSRPGRS